MDRRTSMGRGLASLVASAVGFGCQSKNPIPPDYQLHTFGSPDYEHLYLGGTQIARFHKNTEGNVDSVDLLVMHPYDLMENLGEPYSTVLRNYIRTNYPNIGEEDVLFRVQEPEKTGMFSKRDVELAIGKPMDKDDVLDIFYDGLWRGRLFFGGDYTSREIIGIRPAQTCDGDFRITAQGVVPDLVASISTYITIMKKHGDPLNISVRLKEFEDRVYSITIPDTEEGGKKAADSIADAVVGFLKDNPSLSGRPK